MSAPAIVSIVRGPDFECEFSNLAHRQLYGGRDVLGVPGLVARRDAGDPRDVRARPLDRADGRGQRVPDLVRLARRRHAGAALLQLHRGAAARPDGQDRGAPVVLDRRDRPGADARGDRESVARAGEAPRERAHGADRRRDREPGEGRLPGDRVARAPDASQRHPRLDRGRPASGAEGARAGARDHRTQRARADADHRGRARRVADRRRQAPARHRRGGRGGGHRGRARDRAPGGGGPGGRALGRRRRRRDHRRRRRSAAAGRLERPVERHQVHARRRATSIWRPRGWGSGS